LDDAELGVVEHYTWHSQQEGADVSIGQRERSYSSAAPSAAYTARNYASNIAEYNRKLLEINNSRRAYLMRDIYEDMQIDGVQPVRDTFHTLISGCMKGDRLQDVMYFFEEMKAMGLAPDVAIYNSVILSCGRCNQIDHAFQVAEEMESNGIPPKHRTFLALLKSCGIAGRVDEAYGVPPPWAREILLG
jgi:pentatricopeptide repeat protein